MPDEVETELGLGSKLSDQLLFILRIRNINNS